MSVSVIPERAVIAARREKVHVLFVVDQLPPSLGGGERALLRMIAGLPKDRFRCSLLVLAPFEHDLSNLPAEVHLYPLTSAYNFEAAKYARALVRLIRTQQVDVVVTFFESSDIWAGSVTKLFTSVKVVWNRRDLGILRGRKHQIAYRLLRWVPDRVIAVSEQVRQLCIRQDGTEPSRVTTVYNGTEIPVSDSSARKSIRAQFGIPEKATWVVCTANVRRVKGLDVLLDAVNLLQATHSNTVFTVVGGVNEPDHMRELQDAVARLGLKDRFRFLGPSDIVPQILTAADLFVLPSRSEGFSNALIEAMAAGLPSVVTDVGGNAEAVRDGQTGIIVPAEDVGALASGLHVLLADLDRARAMGIAARLDAEARFSNQHMIQHLAEVLEEVCEVTAAS